MSSKRLYHTEGIVVHRRNQGEADRVLTLCTPLGKQQVIAKGVRKVRSRKVGQLELFAHVRLTVAKSRSSWDVVSQADMLEPYAPLRDDLMRGTFARYAVELYDQFVVEGEGDETLFDLLSRTLQYLCQEDALDLLMRAYEQRLLLLVGYRPEWDHCVGERGGVACGRTLPVEGNQPLGLHPERGGALCPECYQTHREQHGIIPFSPATLRMLQLCRQEPFTRLREYPVTSAITRDMERVARHYIVYYLEREVRTDLFLRQLRRGNKR